MLKKENEKAVQYFLKAIEQQPDVPARYWNAALALEQTGKYDSAMQYARKYMDMEQDSAGRQRASGFIEHLNKMMGR
jgi:tetratricopeptide (TPR) repeat protein